MKSYTLRPDTFTLNFNVLFLSGTTTDRGMLCEAFVYDARSVRELRESVAKGADEPVVPPLEDALHLPPQHINHLRSCRVGGSVHGANGERPAGGPRWCVYNLFINTMCVPFVACMACCIGLLYWPVWSLWRTTHGSMVGSMVEGPCVLGEKIVCTCGCACVCVVVVHVVRSCFRCLISNWCPVY